MKKVYRQGDVCFVRVEELPSDLAECKMQRKDTFIFAYGETAGACHQVSAKTAKVYANNANLDSANDVYMVADKGADIVHFKPSKTDYKHGNLPLPAGKYKVIRQREYLSGVIQARLD